MNDIRIEAHPIEHIDSNSPSQEHDSPWKEALELRFPEFLDLLFPPVYNLIDWSEPITFLDKELQQIMPDAEHGRTYADKLVKLKLTDGQEKWLLVHVEVQGEPEDDFAQRMFKYNYRIRDKYNKDVISLAVLSDTNKKFRPDCYEFSLAGCRILFEFPMVKLLDWKDRLDELLTSENVFALIVAAQLHAKLFKKPEQKRDAKIQLIRLLYERDYSREQVIELLRLVDWMIRLPHNLDIEVKHIVDQIEEERHMAYVTSFERIAREEGEQQGKLEGKLEQAIEMIREFNLSVELVAERCHLSIKELKERLNQIEK
jgi:AraC-like DNA-binding protein